jgi:hypothetical protein
LIAIAQLGAIDAGVGDATTFRVHSFVDEPIEPADIVMMIGVIEYYRDLDDLIPRVAAAARESLIIVDTRGPWWRRTLRYVLARVKHFHLYYHAPDRVAAVAARAGLAQRARVAGHSYTAFWFRRPSAER